MFKPSIERLWHMLRAVRTDQTGNIAVIANLRRGLEKLCMGEGGNVAITFVLTLIAITYLVGAAIDYSRANNVKAGWSSAAWMNTIGPSSASHLPPCVANPLQQGDVE